MHPRLRHIIRMHDISNVQNPNQINIFATWTSSVSSHVVVLLAFEKKGCTGFSTCPLFFYQFSGLFFCFCMNFGCMQCLSLKALRYMCRAEADGEELPPAVAQLPAAGLEARRLHRRRAAPHPRPPLPLGQPVMIIFYPPTSPA